MRGAISYISLETGESSRLYSSYSHQLSLLITFLIVVQFNSSSFHSILYSFLSLFDQLIFHQTFWLQSVYLHTYTRNIRYGTCRLSRMTGQSLSQVVSWFPFLYSWSSIHPSVHYFHNYQELLSIFSLTLTNTLTQAI